MRDLYPALGTMAPAGIGESAYDASIHGSGCERWLRVDAADRNSMVTVNSNFDTIDLEGYMPGRAMQVTSKHEGGPLARSTHSRRTTTPSPMGSPSTGSSSASATPRTPLPGGDGYLPLRRPCL